MFATAVLLLQYNFNPTEMLSNKINKARPTQMFSCFICAKTLKIKHHAEMLTT